MRHYSKLTGILLFVLLLTVPFLGCRDYSKTAASRGANFSSYRDIPGVTAEEVAVVEALREKHDHFIYAMMFSTEAFLDEDGEIQGYAPLVCEW